MTMLLMVLRESGLEACSHFLRIFRHCGDNAFVPTSAEDRLAGKSYVN
jgi:hypothetical protein